MSNWKIEGLYVAQTADYADVVTDVSWACYGNNTMRGKLTLGFPGEPFVQYADLTEDKVLGWVWAQVDKAFVEADVDAAGANAPVVAVKPLPWVE
jgi:hypothetical protein